MNIDEKPVFDSREYPTGVDFDRKTGILTVKSKKHNMEFKGQELRDFLEESAAVARLITSRSSKVYPAQVLLKDTRLSDVILTNDSMNEFTFCSDVLSDPEYLNDLRDKKFHKRDIPITSRNLNSWIHSYELFVDDRGNIEKWHSFSKIDVAYIYILKACRDFGISVRKLQIANESFRLKLPNTDFSLLEIAYTYYEKNKENDDLYMYMDITGRCNIALLKDIMLMAQEKMINKNFILNLTEVWNEM